MKKPIFILSLLFITCTTLPKAENPHRVVQRLNEDGIQFVDFIFSDLLGNIKEVTLPISRVPSAFDDGLFFDGSSVPGCTSIFESDMLLKPDCHTLRTIPWLRDQQSTARVICDVFESEDSPYAGSPRYILNRLIEQAREMGFEFNVGSEIEFFLLDENGNPFDNTRYFAADTDIEAQAYKRAILSALMDQGINIEKIHHEVAPGQYEIVIRYGNAVSVADQITLAKHTLKSLAQQMGLKATFMPKPLFGQNGSGMHIHFSLFDIEKDCNAFYDAQDGNNLSQTAKYFIAGVLKHINGLNALFNSTVNSYKRLVPGYEAPIYICWGTKNRSALIRIPETNANQPYAKRAELRSPDPSCNPYLAFAALLKAGLEGVKNKEELTPEMKCNLYKISPEQRAELGVRGLPTSLENAIEELNESDIAFDLLGDRLFTEFTNIKKQEIHGFNTAVTDWEIKQYS